MPLVVEFFGSSLVGFFSSSVVPLMMMMMMVQRWDHTSDAAHIYFQFPFQPDISINCCSVSSRYSDRETDYNWCVLNAEWMRILCNLHPTMEQRWHFMLIIHSFIHYYYTFNSELVVSISKKKKYITNWKIWHLTIIFFFCRRFSFTDLFNK